MKVEQMFAFIGVDRQGNEGIIAMQNPVDQSWMPMIFSNEKQLVPSYPVALTICQIENKQLKIVKFIMALDITQDVIDQHNNSIFRNY